MLHLRIGMDLVVADDPPVDELHIAPVPSPLVTKDSHQAGPSARDAVRDADLVVNATPIGMKYDDPSPVPPDWLRSGQVVYDMVYRPAQTAFMKAATAAGALAVGGLGMLVAQGALAIEIWTESAQQRAPRVTMRSAAEHALAEAPSVDSDAL